MSRERGSGRSSSRNRSSTSISCGHGRQSLVSCPASPSRRPRLNGPADGRGRQGRDERHESLTCLGSAPCSTAGCSFAVPPRAWRPGWSPTSNASRSMSTSPCGSGRRTSPRWRPPAGRPSRCPRWTTARTGSSSRTTSSCTATAPWSRDPVPTSASRRRRRSRTLLGDLGYDVVSIEAPGTLDGGDVLKHGGTVWVGLGGRTNQSGVDQLAAYLEPYGARVVAGAGQQGAAPEVGRHRPARRHRGRLPAARRRPGRLAVVPRRARGARARTSSCSATTLRADERRRAGAASGSSRSAGSRRRGRHQEFEKLEGCVTCLSVRLRHTP